MTTTEKEGPVPVSAPMDLGGSSAHRLDPLQELERARDGADIATALKEALEAPSTPMTPATFLARMTIDDGPL